VSDPCAGRIVARLEHIVLATGDLERLRDFYCQLGATCSPEAVDTHTGLRSCVLDFCGIRLELLEQPGDRRVDGGDERPLRVVRLGLALGSADAVDEVSDALAVAGHRVLETPRRAGEAGRYASVVLDPDGNLLMLTV
jgi:catechol 2,3-dioxygenase-like lactoylglutathione lyase family enzyme